MVLIVIENMRPPRVLVGTRFEPGLTRRILRLSLRESAASFLWGRKATCVHQQCNRRGSSRRFVSAYCTATTSSIKLPLTVAPWILVHLIVQLVLLVMLHCHCTVTGAGRWRNSLKPFIVVAGNLDRHARQRTQSSAICLYVLQ